MNNKINFIQPKMMLRVLAFRYRQFLVGIGISVLIILVLALFNAWSAHKEKVDLERVYSVQRKEQDLTKLVAKQRNKEKEIQTMFERMKSFNNSYKIALLAAVACDKNIVFDKVDFSENSFTISGKAKNENDVREYIRKLGNSLKGVILEEEQNMDTRNATVVFRLQGKYESVSPK